VRAMLLAGLMAWSGCAVEAQPRLESRALAVPATRTSTAAPDVPAAAIVYRAAILRAWEHYFDLAEPASIAFAQIHQESRWKADARSPVGAAGLGQFMPATAEWIHGMLPADVRAACPVKSGCPTDPGWAIAALARFDYLLFREQSWASPWEDHWAAVLAAYNGGSGWLVKERKEAAARGIPADGWYGKVERVCIRSAAACKENRHYPIVIMRTWRPLYRGWLGD
jgi:soluble lytic murein transglycosylase-like protein